MRAEAFGYYTSFVHRAAASWLNACIAGAWRTWCGATAARWAARLVVKRWTKATVAAAWRTWKGEVSDATLNPNTLRPTLTP
eukprot:scaffold122368_cov42-Phaeocystis_antarctica.AAC.1